MSDQNIKVHLPPLAQHLKRTHRKNLASRIRYRNDKIDLALVYEYMSKGNLQDHLRGTAPCPRNCLRRWLLQLRLQGQTKSKVCSGEDRNHLWISISDELRTEAPHIMSTLACSQEMHCTVQILIYFSGSSVRFMESI